MSDDDDMLTDWVIGRVIGDRAKSILDHAAQSTGYIILESGKQGSSTFCLYAFRRPIDSPIPDHLNRADMVMASRLNKRFRERHTARQAREHIDNPNYAANIAKLRERFYTRQRAKREAAAS